MSRIISAIRGLHRREAGQTLVLFALAAAVLVGAVGMAVDVGLVVHTRTDLQKAADAAVFAGGQDLPSTSAVTVANDYVNKNVAGATATITLSNTSSANDTLTVTVKKRVNYTFMRVLGLRGADISARAVIRRSFYSGGAGLLPWGFIASNDPTSTLLQNSCFTGFVNGLPTFKQNWTCTIKYGAGTSSGGDFGALVLGQPGADQYRSNIKNGSMATVRAGDKLDAETGNMVGPTDMGLGDRLLEPAPAGCPGNSKAEVLTTNPDGSVSITSGCENSPRIGILPVVDQINNPLKSTVLGFAFVFIEGQVGNGGNSRVNVQFVKFVTELPRGIYTGTSGGATAVKLVE